MHVALCCIRNKIKKEALRRGLKEFDRIAMSSCHEGRQHFNLQTGDFGQEANAIRHAAFMCFQHIENVAHNVERPLLDALAAEDNLLRVYSVWDYQCRLLVAERSSCKADG